MGRVRVRAPLHFSAVAGAGLLLLTFGTGAPDVAARTAADQSSDTPQFLLSQDRRLARLMAAERGLDYVPGEVIVRFKPGTLRGAAQRALSVLSGRPSLDDAQWIGDAMVVHDSTLGDAYVMAEQLRQQPEVESAEPNVLRRLPAGEKTGYSAPAPASSRRPLAVATDPSFNSRQWNFPDIDLPRAWDINPGGDPSVTVAIIDTGVTTATRAFTFALWNGSALQNFSLPYTISPDLSASRFVSARDFVLFATGSPVLDMDGHGTHVASTIGEDTNNGISLAGVAYNVRLMPLKVCLSYWDLQIIRSGAGQPGFVPLGSGFCDTASVANAIRFAADNGAKVINLSLGGESPANVERDAISYAVGRGAFVAISNGNNFEQGNRTNYPAAFAGSIDGAMAVGSTGRSRGRAYYSATGTHTEIAAPGGSIRDGASGSGLIWQMIVNQDDASENLIVPRFDRFREEGFQGTSMASPHVAGVAALLMSQIPGITPAQVEQLIRSEALDLGAAGRDNDFGFGLIQPRRLVFGRGIRK